MVGLVFLRSAEVQERIAAQEVDEVVCSLVVDEDAEQPADDLRRLRLVNAVHNVAEHQVAGLMA